MIQSNVISANIGLVESAGINVVSSGGKILDNQVVNNRHDPSTPDGQGGGIALNSNSSTQVSGNLISGNVARCDAGGIGIYTGSNPLVTNNTITYNKAIGASPCGVGGGVKFFPNTLGMFYGNTVAHNEANVAGAGVMIERNSSPLIDRNLIMENTATSSGGGILLQTGSQPTITNNFIIKNVVLKPGQAGPGDGIYSYNQGSGIINNTLVGTGTGEGIHILAALAGLQIYNNIITGFDTGIARTGQGTLGSIDYNDFWQNSKDYSANNVVGAHLVFGDPRFANPGQDDYRLTATSAAIDKGTATGAPKVDFYGTARPQHAAVDIGAHEFAGSLTPQVGSVTVSASPTSIEADGASHSTVTAVVKDSGDQPIAGVQVTFTTSLGIIDSLATTNGSGEATATLTAGTVAGMAQIQATAGGISGGTQVDLVAVTHVSGNSVDQFEGNSGGTPFTFVLTRTGNISQSLLVSYTTGGSGSHPADGADFVGGVLPNGHVTFPPDASQQAITLTVQGDTIVEPDETFAVTLLWGQAGSGHSTVLTGTIRNDDHSDLVISKAPSTEIANAGDLITYTYRITNTGSVTITDVTAQDDKLGPVTLDHTTLAPNAVAIGNLIYTVRASDEPGPLVNQVTVAGTQPEGARIQVQTSASVVIRVVDRTPHVYLPRIER